MELLGCRAVNRHQAGETWVAGLPEGQMAVLSLCKESSPGTVNLGVGHGGRGLTCSIALGPKDGAGVAASGPWEAAGPLSTSAQSGGISAGQVLLIRLGCVLTPPHTHPGGP